ncbi:hypothetical protein BDY24DRAFT_381822 [Mrakia frigida]|uniref:mitochondrial 37S ribosomal protein uS14m MRP2 n=1 Tax=Mrakia frigida TaxID=29902 RepID=UPI003FCBF674
MKRRQLFERAEVIRRAYLFVARNETLPDTIRTRAQQALHRLPKKCTPTEVKNTCIKTGKARGINSEFKLSRIQFRLDANRGKIPGVKRAVW